MSTHTPHVLGNAGDVRALLETLPAFGWPVSRRVSVTALGIDDDARRRWERRLSLWLTACGCQTGALCALGALAWRVMVALHEPLAWRAMFAHAGWVFACALAGKMIGLLVARVMLVVELRRLARAMVTS